MTKNIKIITLGASQVGKTSIIERIVNNNFNENQLTTMATDTLYITREYKKKNLKMRLNFIDTAGQERYCQIPIQYIRDCHIVILIYSNLEDLDELKNRWFKFYKENSNTNKSKFIVVANKSDLFGENRKKIKELGKEFAEEINNSFFISCSAKSDDNIDNLEDYILTEAKRIIDEEEQNEQNNSQNLNNRKVKIEKVKKNNDNIQKSGYC